jgi:hypothetical protein
MATIKKNWVAVQDLYKTDGYGGSDVDIDGTERFSSDVDLETDGHEGAHCHLKYDASGTTDDLEIAVYSSLDGTNYDDIAMTKFIADNNSGAETEISFVVKDVAHFRAGLKRSGNTDIFEAHLTCQRWNYISA